MKIRVRQSSTHLELITETSCITQPEALPLLELTAGTPCAPLAEAFTVIDTLAVLFRETKLRTALVEVIAPSRNLWLLEHIDIWNHAFEKKMTGAMIAYVVTMRTIDRDLIFAEKYAGKLGIRLKYFTAKSDAASWLLHKQFLHASERDSMATLLGIETAVRKAKLAEPFYL